MIARQADWVTEDVTGSLDEIDWGSLALSLDALDLVDTRKGQLALARIIGVERLQAAVDWYIAGRPGAELARFALWRLQPPAARDRCVEVWRSAQEPIQRQLAVELLRVVATSEDLGLIGEFLDDEDEGVQVWGVGVLDQLIWSRQVEPEDAAALLEIAANHPNKDVRERCEFIREVVRDRDVAGG